MSKLERESRHWPLVYADTLIYTLSQDLHPLPVVVRRDAMSEQDFEECKKVYFFVCGACCTLLSFLQSWYIGFR